MVVVKKNKGQAASLTLMSGLLLRKVACPLFLAVVLSAGNVVVGAADKISLKDMEHKMAELVNKDRMDEKLPPLKYSERLADVARSHSKDMVENDLYSHDSPRTGNQADRIFAAGIPCRASAENIVVDEDIYKGEVTLMNSPGHRKNILRPKFTHIGIGIVPSKDGRICATQNFIEALEDISGSEMAVRLLAGINSERQARRLGKLKRKRYLDDAARKAAKKFYKLQKLENSALPGVLSGLKQRRKKCAVLSFLAGSPEDIYSNQQFMDKRWDSIGIGAVRNDTKAHGLGFFWIVMIIEGT